MERIIPPPLAPGDLPAPNPDTKTFNLDIDSGGPPRLLVILKLRGNREFFYCTMRKETDGARDLRRIIAILAAAILLAAPGNPARRTRRATRRGGNVPCRGQRSRSGHPRDVSLLPLLDTADLTSSPDNAAAQDNTAASAGRKWKPGSPPSAGSLPPPRYPTRSSRSTGDLLRERQAVPVGPQAVAKGYKFVVPDPVRFPCATSS